MKDFIIFFLVTIFITYIACIVFGNVYYAMLAETRNCEFIFDGYMHNEVKCSGVTEIYSPLSIKI